jgi:tetratricopeptide (TPR) repeat protein
VPTLRIKHTDNRVLTSLEGGETPVSDDRPFSFHLSAQDAADIRWYLEDYPIYPTDPQPKIAKRIEQRMAEAGRDLFRQVFERGDVWQAAKRHLNDTRIEIETEVDDSLVPWELLRDPVADNPLALAVPSFVRRHSRPALAPDPPKPGAGKIRILVAICRPRGEDDVPFRSVARHLIRGLSEAARESFELEVLRPPTFEQLAKRLREAKAQGEPFHALHFDGHGLNGKIFFENPKLDGNAQPVSASDLGKLLHETHVPLLILNACRSADNEPPEHPEQVGDLHEQIRQFGSFAHAVMDYGATGVVAWRYSVFVNTAAQYMLDLYGALSSGMPLGIAATLARKQLSSGNRDIEDWTVPIVFEAVPARLFPEAKAEADFKLELPTTTVESSLPQAPDIGFIGRDETILKLDRTFDDQNIVLLHAYAGSGKTSTATEFVRWYQQTGGLDGPVLFTSFEQHKTLPQVLDTLGRVFEGVLAKSKIQWLTLTDAQRREVALQILCQSPVFWIWDNVEPIAGFPTGTQSAWSAAEQKELSDFLRAARDTKAKLLLTSRRDERDWLRDLPACIQLPPIRLEDQVQMTRELAEKRGRRLEDVDDWRLLLRFTQGNPMTLTVLVGQALRDCLRTKEQIAEFVARLQAGEEVFEDEASEGRTRSLAASLAYGFENAFTEFDRKQLALLYLFQGYINVETLRFMGKQDEAWCLPEIKGLSRDAGIALLDRAAEIGLATGIGGGHYSIHPSYHGFSGESSNYSVSSAPHQHAYVQAMAYFGNFCIDQYDRGNADVVGLLTLDEDNLLAARGLARSNQWWPELIGIMQGIRVLYLHTGRLTQWTRLVEEIVMDVIDPPTDGPIPGAEKVWSLVTQYRVHVAREERRWDEAERLQSLRVNWNRQRAMPVLERSVQTWIDDDKNRVRTLGVSLHELSEIQRERQSVDCVKGYEEGMALGERVGDTLGVAACAYNLGRAYEELTDIRDLTKSEHWCKRSLDIRPIQDRLGRALCLSQLGTLEYYRYVEARDSNQRHEKLLGHLAKAETSYREALALLPVNAVPQLASAHHHLGMLYGEAGYLKQALHHDGESIRYKESMNDRHGAALTRFNAARDLARAGRFVEGRDWAQVALRDFEACENADQDIAKTLKLLEWIESARQATSPPSSGRQPLPH